MKRVLFAIGVLGLFSAPVLAQSGDATAQADPTPVPIRGGAVVLEPNTTSIEFIGTHEGDEPRPRRGGFEKFQGRAEMDASGALRSITLDIDTGSLWTEIDRLTNHLKSPDFFDVREHPKAAFRSTSIAPAGEPGKFTIQGDLTLLGTTKQISIPATVKTSPQGLTLVSAFDFDRRDFGMTYGEGQVKPDVAVRVVVGEKTRGEKETPAPGRAR